MLLAELARFTYTFNLLLFEGWELDDDSFRLHALELLEVDMVDSFMSKLYVSMSFSAFCKHGLFPLVRMKNEHLALFSSVSDESAFFRDETTSLVESNLHALLHNLVDKDQILCDGQYM